MFDQFGDCTIQQLPGPHRWIGSDLPETVESILLCASIVGGGLLLLGIVSSGVCVAMRTAASLVRGTMIWEREIFLP